MHQVSTSILGWICRGFGCQIAWFLECFLCCFHFFLEPYFRMIFIEVIFHVADFPFWTNPRRDAFYLVKHMVFTHSSLSKKTFFHKPIFRNILFVRSVFASMFHHFSRLFRHWFLLSVSIDVSWKRIPKWHQKCWSWCTFFAYFSHLFATFSFISILCWFWLPFVTLLAPSGTLWATFGSLLAHFRCPLAHFWCPWDHFCPPWRSIFSL